ncbi:hypothetical protein K504DRAFT_425191 [Pleomassaria siparia CBS 279.74]|uniref:AN1-type domain-containing protein n=1 Tax=Pleomassaria siparia CBS 279.74 TaxID=1314801 RepID=A0A6G1KND4_9PLEO|nr:hypothetical protein K504DRAFT_425191 [Pleomassaria siparia CBS 279.74]
MSTSKIANMASSRHTPTDNPESFTAMQGDLDAIGAHCQMEYCHKLDLLPFKCMSCKSVFCLDHRSETAHQCLREGAWATEQRLRAMSQTPSMAPARPADERKCAEPECRSQTSRSLTTGVHCGTCNRQYCLKHRMQEDHNCKNLIPIGARPTNPLQAQRERGRLAFARLKTWAEEKRKQEFERHKEKKGVFGFATKVSAASVAREKLAEMNALKKAAKGEASIPQDKRIYLNVEASADTTKAKFPTGKFFYNKEWTVGRVLDVAAKALQVENVNNRSDKEEDKLRVFHVEGGRLLKFSEKIGAPCANGNMIVLLRGVGDGEPDLIDL